MKVAAVAALPADAAGAGDESGVAKAAGSAGDVAPGAAGVAVPPDFKLGTLFLSPTTPGRRKRH